MKSSISVRKKYLTIPNVLENTGQQECSHTTGGSVDWYTGHLLFYILAYSNSWIYNPGDMYENAHNNIMGTTKK